MNHYVWKFLSPFPRTNTSENKTYCIKCFFYEEIHCKGLSSHDTNSRPEWLISNTQNVLHCSLGVIFSVCMFGLWAWICSLTALLVFSTADSILKRRHSNYWLFNFGPRFFILLGLLYNIHQISNYRNMTIPTESKTS